MKSEPRRAFYNFYLASCSARKSLYERLADALKSKLGRGWSVILTELGIDGAISSSKALLEIHYKNKVIELCVNTRCNAVRILQTGKTEKLIDKIVESIQIGFKTGKAVDVSVLIVQRAVHAEKINIKKGNRYTRYRRI